MNAKIGGNRACANKGPISATKGINIPNCKASCKHIIELFKKNPDKLRLKLTVSLTTSTAVLHSSI